MPGLSYLTNNMLHVHLCTSEGFVGKNLCQLLRYLAAAAAGRAAGQVAGKSTAVISVFSKIKINVITIAQVPGHTAAGRAAGQVTSRSTSMLYTFVQMPRHYD